MVHSGPQIKYRPDRPPDIDQVRPGCCPMCKTASQQPGRPLNLVGHGSRQRQLRALQKLTEPPQTLVLYVRRFWCRACERSLTVIPWEVVPGRWYGLRTIAFAIALFGLSGQSADVIRKTCSPWPTFDSGWRQLQRWIRDFAHKAHPRPTHRASAEALALRFAAAAGLGHEFDAQAAWHGGHAYFEALHPK